MVTNYLDGVPSAADRGLPQYSETTERSYVVDGVNKEDCIVPVTEGVFHPLMSVEKFPLYHGHGFANPIFWNNIQEVAYYNYYVKLAKHAEVNPDAIFYLRTKKYPTMGYNQHTHINEFDGGLIYGGGLHAHSNPNDGGYAFAVYHPGTWLSPTTMYIEDEDD